MAIIPPFLVRIYFWDNHVISNKRCTRQKRMGLIKTITIALFSEIVTVMVANESSKDSLLFVMTTEAFHWIMFVVKRSLSLIYIRKQLLRFRTFFITGKDVFIVLKHKILWKKIIWNLCSVIQTMTAEFESNTNFLSCFKKCSKNATIACV